MQPIEAYDLSNITESNFFIVDKALFNNNQIIKFLAPNKNYVSHSISNWQNNFNKKSDFIEVETISILDIISYYNIENISLIKLDI